MWYTEYAHVFTIAHLYWVVVILLFILLFRFLWWLSMRDFDIKKARRENIRDFVALKLMMEHKRE